MMSENQITNEENAYVKIEVLKTQFFTGKGIVKAIDGVDLSIRTGEVFGLVGESGCGKSVTATSIMDLVPDPPGRIVAGKIFIDGFNIVGDLDKLVKIDIRSPTDVRIKRNKRLLKRHNFILSGIRGKKIAMIFQEPFLALNPVMKIGDQIIESIMLHSMVEMANSIIRRETLKDSDIQTLMDRVRGDDDPESRRRIINRWSREYGIPEEEESILDLFESSQESSFIKKGLVELVQQHKSGMKLDHIVTTRDYYKYMNQLHDLHLSLINAENANNVKAISDLNAKISALSSAIRSQFSGYRIARKLMRRRVDAPFREEAKKRALELIKLVNIAGGERILNAYPHELSGGMQQRAMIAMSLSSNPKMLIADEPTTALDVTTQAQILELIRDLNRVTNASVLFITHDLAVVAEMCNRVGVMYAGNLVEQANVKDIFADPKHPYTIGLMSAVPRADVKREKEVKLESIPGTVPNLVDPPTGCRFHPRCKFAMDVCSQKKPKLVEVSEGHSVACFLYSNETVEESQ